MGTRVSATIAESMLLFWEAPEGTVVRTSIFKTIVIAAVSLAVCLSTACTTMRPVAIDSGGQQFQPAIHAGDKVRVLTKSGATHDFQVTSIGATSLSGTSIATWRAGSDPVGSSIELPYVDIVRFDVRRVSGLKTAGIIAAAIAVAIGIASGGGSHQAGYGNR
jgi:hypothetical protein